MTEPTIRLDGLSHAFRGTVALDGLDLELHSGVTGLLGPNGAGKTTLLRVLATVLHPDRGTVRILGRDPADGHQRIEIRRRLGYLPQEIGYPRGFTAYGFVDYMAVLKEIDDPDARRREIRWVLEDVGLGDRASRRISCAVWRAAPTGWPRSGTAELAGAAGPRRAHHRPRP